MSTRIESTQLASPELLAGRYAYLRELGRGSEGRVILAADRAADLAQRAIKVVADTDVERVRWEFQLLSRIAHPNLSRVFDLVRVDKPGGAFDLPRGAYALVSEVAPGVSADRFARSHAADRDALLKLCSMLLDRVARALSALHARGLVHGDVKPENVVVTEDLSDAKLIDLGLARAPGFERTLSGTPGFIAPELFRGELLPASDLYSLGRTVCALLQPDAAVVPASRVNALAFHDEASTLPPWLPPPFAELVRALCAPDAGDRPASARELVRKLGALASDERCARFVSLGQELPEAEARTAKERAQAITSLPLIGRGDALAELVAQLGRPGVVCVVGPRQSGRSRLIREAAGLLQIARAKRGSALPTYQVVRSLPMNVLAPCSIVHVEHAEGVSVEAARALVRSAEVTGDSCSVVLEREVAPEGDVPSLTLGPVSDLELESLLRAALPEEPIKAPLVREARAASGGLPGRLCHLLAAGIMAGEDPSRALSLRARASGPADVAARLPESCRELAELLAVCGGALSQEVAAHALGDEVALAEAAQQLAALGLSALNAHDELELRADVELSVRGALTDARRTELARKLPETMLDGRARSFVAFARSLTAQARSSFVAEIAELIDRGETAEAVRLGHDAFALLGTQERDDSLSMALAEAQRALGRYDEALITLQAQSSAEGLLARAEIERLLGHTQAARELAERASISAQLAATASNARVLLARLSLDEGRPEEARSRARDMIDASADERSVLRAAEVSALADLQLGNNAAAQSTLEHAMPLARASTSRSAEARLTSVLAAAARDRGDLRGAGKLYARAWELADAAGEYHAAASFLVNLGTAHLDAGELSAALDACRQGARRLALLGRQRDLARVLYNLAFAASLIGDYDAALASAEEAAHAARAAHDPAALTFSLVLSAEIFAARGDAVSVRARLKDIPDAELSPQERIGAAARATVALCTVGDREAAEVCFAAAQLSVAPEAAVEVELAACAMHALGHDSARSFEAAERALSLAKARGEFGVHLSAALAAARAAEAVGDRALAGLRYAEVRSLLDAAALSLAGPDRARLREVPGYRSALAALPRPSEARSDHEARYKKLASLAKRLTAESRVSHLYDIVLDAAIDLSGAERGYLLWNDAEGVARVRAGRGLDRKTAEADSVSRSIVTRVITTGKALSTVDALADARLSNAASVHALALRSVMAVPIRAQGEVCGALYLDDRLRPFAFADEEVALLSDLADLAAIALQSAQRLRRERRTARRLLVAQERLARRVQAQDLELATFKHVGDGMPVVQGIVAQSGAMQEVLRLSLRVAKSDVPVLLRGESGTGKELVARAIHAQSARSDGPFIGENCGAIPEGLLESALFGHAKGAFTGADKRRIGLFEAADGGTLFLDEIAEMTPTMQTRLLRVLQDGEVRPLGSERTVHVDVRVVAATHRDLESMVARGTFRQDLYYRLAVVSLSIPPLRERGDDVVPLVKHFIDKHAAGRKLRIDQRALLRLGSESWPGNVRQLENEVRRAIVLADDVIREEHFSFAIASSASSEVAELDLRSQVDDLERRLIRRALETAKGNQTRAAELLGVSRFGLQKMQKRLSAANK